MPPKSTPLNSDRRYFIGGSDARIIMGDDEAALVRLWKEKRAEVEPEDLSGNLIVQLGAVTEDLNRRWYEASTGQVITNVQEHVRHPVCAGPQRLMGAWSPAARCSKPNSCCLGTFRKRAAAEKYAPQLQHNMWVAAQRKRHYLAVRSCEAQS
jgi:predicted phage-related endonuclease